MPGYVFHLVEGEMLLRRLRNAAAVPDDAWVRAFRCGLLLPDAADNQSVKDQTHFRDPEKRGNQVVVPDLERFLAQHPVTLEDPMACGYYAHLQLDLAFFSDYLMRYVTFFDADGTACFEKARTVSARLTRSGKEIPKAALFSKDYVYGDYTKLNLRLIDRFGLTLPRAAELPEGSYCGIPCSRLVPELERLAGFIESSRGCDSALNVIEEATLIPFLEECAEKAAMELLQAGDPFQFHSCPESVLNFSRQS